jgi:hypothetical protein
MGYDFNDLVRNGGGLDDCTIISPDVKPASGGFSTKGLSTFLASVSGDVPWLVDRLIPEGGLGVFFGAPASGKSLFTLDLCYCLATGTPLFGMAAKKGRVLYVTGEGRRGLKKRFLALFEKYQHDSPPDNLEVADGAASLASADGIADLAACVEAAHKAGKPFDTIVFDTLHNNFGDASENDERDVKRVLHNLAMLESWVKTIIFVHHSGLADTERMRGSSALLASLDWCYKVSKTDDLITITSTKAKDIDPPDPINLTLERMADSVVLVLADPDMVVEVAESATTLNNTLKALLQAAYQCEQKDALATDFELFNKMIDKPDKVFSRDSLHSKALTLTQSKGKAFLKQNFNRDLKTLVSKGFLKERSGYFWFTDSGKRYIGIYPPQQNNRNESEHG